MHFETICGSVEKLFITAIRAQNLGFYLTFQRFNVDSPRFNLWYEPKSDKDFQ